MAHNDTHKISPEMQKCIDACTRCAAICLETMHHCLHLGGKHADPEHIVLLADCAAICRTSADAMLRGSAHSGHICAACAEICTACEASCRSMGDDEMMKKCADECRRCAESCKRMASMAH